MKMDQTDHGHEVFAEAEEWAFNKMSETSPSMAEMWLAKLEAICWYNYLSDSEAKSIAAKLINQDGIVGAKWNKDTFLSAVEKLGGEIEKEPCYNENALWVAGNMIYSDHAKSIAEDMGYATIAEVPAEKMALSCYKKAVEKLCDKDRKYFIREYFEDEMI